MKRALIFLPLLFVLSGCGERPPVAPQTAGPEAATSPASPASAAVKPPAEPATPPASAASAAVKPPTEPELVHLPAGTTLRVRLVQSIDTERNQAGDRFDATLVSPVMKNGKVILPKGTEFHGHVTSAKPSGRLRGRGYLSVTLDSFELKGQTYRAATSTRTQVTGDHKKRNLALIGGSSGLGALIGGLAGGGKGAAIGAGAGAAAGTTGAAVTGKKHARLPSETVLTFTLKAPVQVRGKS